MNRTPPINWGLESKKFCNLPRWGVFSLCFNTTHTLYYRLKTDTFLQLESKMKVPKKSETVSRHTTEQDVTEKQSVQLWGEDHQTLEKDLHYPSITNYLSFPKKDAEGSVWRAMSCSRDGAIGSGGLRGLFEDYENTYIQSWRPGAISSGLWGLLDQLHKTVKSDGQVKFKSRQKENVLSQNAFL